MSEELEKPKKGRSLSGILWEKVLDYVEGDKLPSRIYRDTMRLIKASLLSYLIWSAPNYNQAIINLAILLGPYSGLIPAAMAGFFIVYKWASIKGAFMWFWAIIDKSLERHKEDYEARKIGPLFEGVPINKLVDIIASGASFGRDLVRDETGCSVEQHAMLKGLFLECGILTKGENNSAVMSNDFTREDLEELFLECDNAEDMKKLFLRKNGLQWVVNDSRLEREKFYRKTIR